MKYNFLKYFVVSLVVFSSCKKKDFVEDNTDPTILYSIKPEEQFANAVIRAHKVQQSQHDAQ